MTNIFEYILGGKFKREISELYVSMAIRDFAAWMIDIYEPIFIYSIFHSLRTVVLYYAIVYTVYIFILPLGGKVATRFGFEHSIFYSIPIAIIYYLVLYNMANYPFLFFYLGAVLFAVYKILFWPAYHANFAYYGNPENRGGEISGIIAISNTVGIIGPLIGGLIVAFLGFKVLFVIGAIIYFISAIPLFTTAEKFTPKHFSYKDAFKRIFNPQGVYKRKDQLAYWGCAEELSVMVLWPMFIYFTIGSISKMGGIVTVSMLVTTLVTLYIGKLANDKEHSERVFKWSAILNSLVWIIKPFMNTFWSVFAIDTVERNIYNAIWVPFSSIIYRKGEEGGFLKYATFFEMNLAIGKAVFAWMLMIILCFTQSWFILFGVTGVIGLLYLNLS